MNRPKKLSEIKAGDTVFVVNQQRRHSEKPPETTHATVTRVGRKYGYFDRGYREEKFDLQTGYSVSSDCNARANRYGFDVYLNEGEYIDQQHAASERRRLQERLIDRHGRLVDELSRQAIAAIHEILDKEQQR